MIDIAFHGKAPVGVTARRLKRLAKACDGVRGLPRSGKATIGVRFVTPREIKRLNRAYRGKNCPTDILSFEAEANGAWPTAPRSKRGHVHAEIGDLVVCASVARREAKRRSIDPTEEIFRLLAHGVLHLAGMDHATPKDEAKMFKVQERIVERVMS